MCVISDLVHTYPNRNRYVVRDTDLLIKEGDYVVVLDTSTKDRWKGLLNQKEVFFPAWVVVENPSLSSSHGTSDCSEDETSLSEPEKRNERHSGEQTARRHTLLQVAMLPEPGGSEKQPLLSDASHTEPEVQGNAQHSTTLCQTSSPADLEVVSQELAVGTAAVSDSQKETGEVGVPEPSSNDAEPLSPVSKSSCGSDDPAESGQKLQRSDAMGGTEGNNGAVMKLQESNITPKQESKQPTSGKAATASPQNSGQSDLELASKELATNTTVVSDSAKATSQPVPPKSNDMKRKSLSPSSSNGGSDEPAKSSHQLQSSGEGQSGLERSGTGTTESTETSVSSSNSAAPSNDSQEPAKKKSKVQYTYA